MDFNPKDFIPKLCREEVVNISPEGLKRLAKLHDPQEPSRHLLWTTDYTVELPIYVKKYGAGSEEPITLITMIENSVDKYGKRSALRVKREGQWKTWTYDDFYRDIKQFANALISLDISNYKAINIIGFNDPAWYIGFYGSIFANVLPVGVYTTNGPDACKYIAEHSEAELVLAEDQVHLKKYLAIWDQLPRLKYIVLYNEAVLPPEVPLERRSQVLLWKDFLEYGAKFGAATKDEKLNQRKSIQKPGNCCTLIYTSGTTGPPKGVMLNHDSYTWLAATFVNNFGYMFPITEKDEYRVLSYLPLSHVAAQFADMVLPIFRGACICFALPTALQGSLIDSLREVRPHGLLSVPRLWEKIEETLKAIGKANGFPKKNIAEWAKSIGVEGTLAELDNKPKPFAWGLAKALVYNNIKKALGLDNCKIFAFGAAPLSESTRTYFASLNIFLMNSYGMSECAGPQTYYCPFKGVSPSLTSANIALPGTEMIIDAAGGDGNGEICFRGRNRFMGYYKDEASTKAAIDERGFLHSGDIGRIGEDGHLYITGRLKELIITGGGENVAPVLIEEEVKTAIPEISQCIVIGDNRKYLTMLITLKHEQASDGTWKERLSQNVINEFKGRGIQGTSVKEVRHDGNFVKYVQEELEKVNAKSTSRVHNVKKWCLLDGDFSIEGGEFTPTLKFRRKIIEKKYSKEIESMYAEPKL